MTSFYWAFKPEADGSTRPDILVEQCDRAAADPTPEIVTVVFLSELLALSDGAALHTMRTEFLTPAQPPG